MTNSTWGSMLNEKPVGRPIKEGYAMHHLEHVGENPMFAQRMAQAFKPKVPKIKLNSPRLDQQAGSPWHMMAGGK